MKTMNWRVCLWPPSTDNKQGLSFILSVHVPLSFCPLPVSHTQSDSQTQPHTHPDKHKQAHTQGAQLHNKQSLTIALQLSYCSYNRLYTCFHICSSVNCIIVISTQLMSFKKQTSSAVLKNTTSHSLIQVYFGLTKLNGRFSGLCGTKHPNDSCLPVCVYVNKGIEVKLHTQPPWHTFICAIRIKGSSSGLKQQTITSQELSASVGFSYTCLLWMFNWASIIRDVHCDHNCNVIRGFSCHLIASTVLSRSDGWKCFLAEILLILLSSNAPSEALWLVICFGPHGLTLPCQPGRHSQHIWSDTDCWQANKALKHRDNWSNT